MFEFIRTHQRLMQFLLLLLILPSFAFFGIEGYMRMVAPDDAVAKVGGVPISQAELDNAQRENLQRMQQLFGNNFDPRTLETPAMKQQALDELVGQRAIDWEVARANLGVTDDKLRATIMGIPAAQVDGQFSKERYEQLLAAQGLTQLGFDARLRRDLAHRLVTSVMQDSAIVSKTVVARVAAIVLQQREVAEQVFKPADFASQVKVTDEMRKAYYDSHPAEFEIPQQLRIEYLVLTNEQAAKQVTVTPEQLAEYYEQNRKRYETPEQRRASHILIAVGKDAAQADKDKARAKAEEVLAKAKAAPNDFAKLAKQYSQDTGSAEKGGDLDFNSKGAMVGPVDDAIFKMRPNEIAGPVQSEFGYHVLRLTAIKPAVGKKLDEVKGEIEGEIVKQLAARKFAELAEQFTNLVYDNADSLKPAADKLKLTIETAEGVTRAATAAKPWANPKVLAALFSDDALKNKRNTEAIEIAPNTLVSARVVEDKPATKKSLDEVKDQVTARVVATESDKLAKAAGAARLAALKGGTADAAGFGAVKTVGRGKADGLPPEAIDLVFKADGAKLPSYTGGPLSSGGYGVYRVSKVVQADAPNLANRANIGENLARQVGELEFVGYLESIKARAKVQVLKPVSGANAVTTAAN